VRIDRRELAAALLPGAAFALALGGAAALLVFTADPAERAQLVALVEPRLALVLFLWFVLAIAGGALLRRAWARYGVAPGRIAEELQVLLKTDTERAIAADGSAGARALAVAVNGLIAQRAMLKADIDAKVRAASREVEQERNRLAALMSELTQSVVVCNLDGRVLLYNSRARLQFRALSEAPAVAGGAELIGLGRSIYAVFDRQLVAHALESVRQRLQRGAPHPAAQFVTGTRGGQLVRVQLAAVRAVADAAAEGDGRRDAEPALAGFVLMLDNITRDFADESARDRLLHQFTEAARASLGNLQAAVELLEDEGLDAATRERFQAIVRDEATAMSRRIQEVAAHTAQTMKTRWPLEEMLGADLVAAASRRIGAAGRCRVASDEVDATLWLKVDSYSLILALASLAARLVDEYEVGLVRLRLARHEERARLDLAWTGAGLSTEIAMGWETDALKAGGETSPLTLRDVVQRHGGAVWFERERVRHENRFRFLLPLAEGAADGLDAELGLRSESRPEYYDFDLFEAGGDSAAALADRRLDELAYTVFDCETTGLQPTAGDEILQIGATRIVAAKLRRQECFEQLVDPGRSIPPAGIPIHGITPEMVQGQPPIKAVLPAFHAFAHETVLVAHNAAFDIRFLQLKEAATGVRFDQPVLDTLLLSAVVHPEAESHSLEAIAERFGVPVLGRHTALGDAIVTAEVFLKMVPLLRDRGIETLGQALEAEQKTYFARISY
jgi:DNA polymerase-3 subunit epsilon